MQLLLDNEVVKNEYERWLVKFGSVDPYDTKETLGVKDVLKAHFLIADYFFGAGYGIAALGPRDSNLLHSVVNRQFVLVKKLNKYGCANMTYRLSELEVLPDDPFKQDALQRKPIVDFLVNLVAKIDGPFVLALDSPWGTGKTTLVRMLKAQLEQQSFYCIYFNAWKSDYATDPLVALVESIERSIKVESVIPDNFDERFNKVKKITGKIARRMIVAGGKILSLGILDVDKDVEAIISDVAADTTDDIVDLFQRKGITLSSSAKSSQSRLKP
jgi:hypothetical protein